MNLDRKVFASCLVALLGVSAAATAQASTVPAEGLQDSVVPAVRYRAAQDGHAAIKLQVTPHAARSAHESAGHGVGAGRIEAERKVFIGGNTEAERKVFIGGNVEAERKVFIGGNVEAERKVFIGGNVEAQRKVFIGGNVEAEHKVFIGGNVEAERKVFIGGNVEAERRFNGCC